VKNPPDRNIATPGDLAEPKLLKTYGDINMTFELHEELSSPSVIVGKLGPGEKKDFIVIHWYGDPKTSGNVHQTAKWLSTQTHASVNYVAGPGVVYCLVSPWDVAYAQGDGPYGYGNRKGISIECDPRCTPEARETVAQLIAKIRRDANVHYPLRPHNDFKGTTCPGVWEQWIPWLSARADEINGAPAPKPATPKPAPAPAAPSRKTYSTNSMHWIVESGDTLSKIARYYYGSDKYVKQIADYNGINKDAPLKVGDRIWVNGPIVWIIEAPDSIRSIAAYYGLDPSALAAKNGLSGPDAEIYIGNTLVIL
jgi:LysM repeat protein